MYERFQQFVNENKEFDVAYNDSDPVLAKEGFVSHRDWFIYEGQKSVKVVFSDGSSSISFDLDYRGNLGEKRKLWSKKAVSTWKRLANEIRKNVEINEVGNTKTTSWYECFVRALQSNEMNPFRLTRPANKISFEKKNVTTGYQNAPDVVAGVDPVNFSPRI
jgi:hypothetical protein